jgi:hypothetical protein
VNDDEWTGTNIQALSGIRTHNLSVEAIKTYVSGREATGIGDDNIVLGISRLIVK